MVVAGPWVVAAGAAVVDVWIVGDGAEDVAVPAGWEVSGDVESGTEVVDPSMSEE